MKLKWASTGNRPRNRGFLTGDYRKCRHATQQHMAAVVHFNSVSNSKRTEKAELNCKKIFPPSFNFNFFSIWCNWRWKSIFFLSLNQKWKKNDLWMNKKVVKIKNLSILLYQTERKYENNLLYLDFLANSSVRWYHVVYVLELARKWKEGNERTMVIQVEKLYRDDFKFNTPLNCTTKVKKERKYGNLVTYVRWMGVLTHTVCHITPLSSLGLWSKLHFKVSKWDMLS